MNPRQTFVEQYRDFRVTVPEGKLGLWEIKREIMTERNAQISTIVGQVTRTDRFALPGTYTLLVEYGRLGNPYKHTIYMSDHLCEVADHEPLVTYARQHAPLRHVLINGLGLGVALVLLEPYVEQFTVIELSRTVIRLVEPHYRQQLGDRLQVVHANALTWEPPRCVRYDAVFHDIWPSISHENLPQMHTLHRKYARRCDWQQSWARIYCEREARKRKLHPEQYEHTVDVKDVMQSINTLFAITEGNEP